MREQLIGILDAFETNDAVVVTTNMVVERGRAVMGAGVAKVIAQAFPEAPSILGQRLRHFGNVPILIGFWGQQAGFKEQWDKLHTKPLWSFPTKHHWKDPSDIRLIIQSAKLLDWELKKYFGGARFSCAIPRPGCSNGGLEWSTVRTHLEPILDDNYLIIDKPPPRTG